MKSKRLKLLNTIDTHPATSHQREYAQSLGITIPQTATKSDTKALVDRFLDEDVQAPTPLIQYARTHNILCSSYIGYKYLHNLMFDNLSILDLSAFFCYCIYQDILGDFHTNLDEHPHSLVFYNFANQYSEDFYFTSSLQDYYGDDLLTFGKNTIPFPDGTTQTVYGGSKQTTAYKLATTYLAETLNVSTSSSLLATPKATFWSKLFPKRK